MRHPRAKIPPSSSRNQATTSPAPTPMGQRAKPTNSCGVGRGPLPPTASPTANARTASMLRMLHTRATQRTAPRVTELVAITRSQLSETILLARLAPFPKLAPSGRWSRIAPGDTIPSHWRCFHLSENGVFRQQAALMFDQQDQQIESLGCQGDGCAV